MTAHPAHSKESYACPKRIASITEDVFNEKISTLLQKIYSELGCKTEFVTLPGKRGILEFNMGQIDGEVFRLKVVEKLYTRPFIKSASPLKYLNSSNWIRPSNKSPILGYSIGIVWQENYMKDKRGVSFHNNYVMFQAYNNGTINGFLANDIIVRNAIQKGELKPTPIKKENLVSAPIHHYIGAEFSDFMAAFSAYIAQHKPFDGLE
jgi:hypothetical protein